MSLWLILVSVALAILIVFGAVMLLLALALRREARRWRDAGVTFVKGPQSANYRGHASIAVPVKGNGLLALTDTDVRFVRIWPHSEYIIPLTQITGLELRRTWKHSYRPGFLVLLVHYQIDGADDAIGFMVRDVTAWGQAIAEAAQIPPPESSDQAAET